MKLNSIHWCPAHYAPPPVPNGLCSQDDLADLILHYLDSVVTAMRPPISDEGIRSLIKLVFFASISPEEGRYPRFNICCQKDFGSPFTVTRFDAIAIDNDSTDSIRRLAPACTHSECAILVSERNERMWCDGVVNIGPMGRDTAPGRPEFTLGGGRPNILIRICGPGHLTARVGSLAYELNQGRIRYLSDFLLVPPVKTLREELAEYLEQELIEREGCDTQTLFGGSKGSMPIHVVLSTMLRVSIDARHGGAFVIIPSDICECKPYSIQLNHVARDLDLGHDIISFWSACANAARKHKTEGYDTALGSWAHRKARMLLAAEAVGNLSCVDGCVVLNRRLQLCGFGGEIKVSDEDAKNAPRNFTNYKSGEEWEYNDFLKSIGGTRHKSAARLSKAHEGILVFVVSQDSTLKVFSSDTDTVNAFGPLDVI